MSFVTRMLYSENTETALLAAECLEGGDDVFVPDESYRKILERLLKNGGSTSTIKSLLDRMS